MPTLTVKTYPLPAEVTIFRIAGRYGIMQKGISPVEAKREFPWTWRIALSPVVDARGNLWVPEEWQYQGLVSKDLTITIPYVNAGKVHS